MPALTAKQKHQRRQERRSVVAAVRSLKKEDDPARRGYSAVPTCPPIDWSKRPAAANVPSLRRHTPTIIILPGALGAMIRAGRGRAIREQIQAERKAIAQANAGDAMFDRLIAGANQPIQQDQ